jgi:hypothetical protein
MTKFERKTFTEVYGSKEYRANWEETFGKDKREVIETHYDNCDTNNGGTCDCELIELSDPDAKEKCSNCGFKMIPKSKRSVGKVVCAMSGSLCPEDYHCESYKPKKGK